MREGVDRWDLHGWNVLEVCLLYREGGREGVLLEKVGLEHGNFVLTYNVKSPRQRKENVSRIRPWLTVSNVAESFISAHRSDRWIWLGEGYPYLEQCH